MQSLNQNHFNQADNNQFKFDYEECQNCDGYGAWIDRDNFLEILCALCRGTGKIIEE